jgi:hypothetical protein
MPSQEKPLRDFNKEPSDYLEPKDFIEEVIVLPESERDPEEAPS